MTFVPPIRPTIKPLTWSEILAYGQPRSADQPEAFRDTIYDTQTYVDNVTTNLSFFQTVQGDKTLGNIQGAGALPAANAFAISAISCELAIGAEAGGVAGGLGLSDASKLLIVGRPTLTFVLSDKSYGPWPLIYCGAAGGLDLQGYGTTTADANAASVGAVAPNGGYFLGNSIILLPNVQFNVIVNWSAAQDLSANRNIRVSLHGTRYRRVV